MADLVKPPTVTTLHCQGEDPEVGQWFWVQDDEEEAWIGCVVKVGSNYAELRGVRYNVRIHLDHFSDRCRYVADPDTYINSQIALHQAEMQKALDKIRELTVRLGVSETPRLSSPFQESALVLHSSDSTKSYERSLVRAKEEELPELFKEVESSSQELGRWMKAKIIPLKAQADQARSVIEAVEERIFHVELYAGLVKTVERIKDGKPASEGEKIHLFQRRCYMDEECLVDYQTGGMEFKNLRAFEKWLTYPRNLGRILPFPRCAVAFQVRRHTKEREKITLSDFIRILQDEESDKTTFLYLRNGEQVYRLKTEVEFEEKLFPDLTQRQLRGAIWAKMFVDHVKGLITDDAYQAMMAEGRVDNFYDYEPYTRESVHYDDISAFVKAEITKHNRIVLILQGILDRSPVWLPHPPWSLWTNEGFEQGLKLIYDDSRALTTGSKPDFEDYRKRLNASLKVGSVTVGQEVVWETVEAERECARIDRSYRRNRSEYRPERYRPYGNPGPGTLARVVKITKGKSKCTFEWQRQRLGHHWDRSGDIHCVITVESRHLLNVDAYTPGDFHQFYADPRTRVEYLQWAPLLLVAEEYHAGNRKVDQRVET